MSGGGQGGQVDHKLRAMCAGSQCIVRSRRHSWCWCSGRTMAGAISKLHASDAAPVV